MTQVLVTSSLDFFYKTRIEVKKEAQDMTSKQTNTHTHIFYSSIQVLLKCQYGETERQMKKNYSFLIIYEYFLNAWNQQQKNYEVGSALSQAIFFLEYIMNFDE